jgi:thiamine biosynthesis lipoprotein
VTGIVAFAGRAMGSPLRLQVATAARATPRPERLWARVQAEFRTSEAELSCYRPESALSQLNGTAGSGAWWAASSRLYGFLTMAERAERKSGGRFDARVLGDLARLGYPGLPAPTARSGPKDSRAARDGAEAGPGWLQRDGRTRRVRVEAPVDSGGLGKGLTLRWAWHRIETDLMGRGALLEAGGDLVGRSAAPDGEAWQIGIEDPLGRPEPLAVVTLSDGAICTSSTARQRWVDPAGRPAHHLLDPRTGEPGGAGLLAVTVAGADPGWAEVWSKTLFLAGPTAIGDEARARGLAVWWVEADGTLRMTPAARQRTIWSAS